MARAKPARDAYPRSLYMLDAPRSKVRAIKGLRTCRVVGEEGKSRKEEKEGGDLQANKTGDRKDDRSRTGAAPVRSVCGGFLLSNPWCGMLTGVAVTPGTPGTFLNRHRTSSPKTISCAAPRRRTNPRDPKLAREMKRKA